VILKQKKNFAYYVIKKWDSSDITQNQIGKLKVNYVEDAGMNKKQKIVR
jgi:hypothetical protein